MNIFQVLNCTSMFLILGAVLLGVNQTIKLDPLHLWGSIVENREELVFVIFFVMLRIKITFDDHKHFGEPQQGENKYREIGFALAFLSWFLWWFAGAGVANLKNASLLLSSALIVSLVWLGDHLLEIRNLPKTQDSNDNEKSKIQNLILKLRQKWVIFNCLYISFLLVYSLAPNPNLLTFRIYGLNWSLKILSYHMLLCCFLLVLFDIAISRPFTDVIKRDVINK